MPWKLEADRFAYHSTLHSAEEHQEADEEREIYTIAEFLGEGALDRLTKIAVPKIVGHELIKTAILLSALSPYDINQDPNRIHVLLYGDPGTGKGKFLSWIKQAFSTPKLSHRSTGAGLSGNASTVGVLSACPIVGVDELDKMSTNDQDALLEAMSDGEIEIAQAQGYVIYPAPVRVIAACNDISEIRPELKDRFDFKIKLRTPDEEASRKILSSRLRGWNSDSADPIEDFWIKLFLTLNSEPCPRLENIEKIENLVHSIIKTGTSSRSYESIIRIALTIAQLELSHCTENHVQQAIDLIRQVESLYS